MKICILSCKDMPHPSEGESLLVKALEAQGQKVSTHPWDEVKATDPYDLFVFRTTWDYMKRWDEFDAWLRTLKQAKVRCVNSLKNIRWNSNKKYMVELQKAGIDIPRTYIWEGQYLPNWIVLEEALGSPPFVFKPLISGGGLETFIVQGDVSYSAAIDRMKKKPFIAQNFIREVKRGEISAMVFGGEYSHSVIKKPQGGEFRVQAQYGGTLEAYDLDSSLQKWAEEVVRKAPELPTYARVDFAIVNDKPILMELEIFEPELFLNFKEGSAEKLASLMLKNNS